MAFELLSGDLNDPLTGTERLPIGQAGEPKALVISDLVYRNASNEWLASGPIRVNSAGVGTIYLGPDSASTPSMTGDADRLDFFADEGSVQRTNGSSTHFSWDLTSLTFSRNATFSQNLTVNGDSNLGNGSSDKAYIAGDANWNLGITSSKPRITFDTSDYVEYDRTANSFDFRIGGSSIVTVTSSGLAGTVTVPNASGIKILDTDASHSLGLVVGSNLTAARTLTVTTGDNNRTLDISAANVTITAAGAALIDDADASAQRTTLGLVIGTNVQAQNANLAAFAGLTLVADRLTYANGSGTLALATFTAAGRALVDDADATAQRTTLGLGTIATQAASAVAITGGTANGITSLGVGTGTPAGVANFIVSSSGGSGVATWGGGHVLISTAGSSTAKGLGFAVDTSGNRTAIYSLQPGTAWLGADFFASDFLFYQGGTLAATINSSGLSVVGHVKTSATTVGSLGSAATAGAGARRFVTDANATTFASVVAAGGANGVPVYSDGTNWRIG